jgi:hypothetical protein
MTTLLSPYDLAVTVEACIYAAIDHSANWPINRHGVVIGEIAWDDCACGQLVVSETRRYGATAFPLEAVIGTDNCNEPWLVVAYTVSLTRCVAVSQQSGEPPAISSLQASAQQNSLDMTQARRALQCCLSSHYDDNTLLAWEIGSQEVTGPGGQCAGFDMTFFAGWSNDCGC